jgi:tetratricopeptide (TPR) repeat protein
MALRFWGWEGTQKTTEEVLKPFIKDRNVMPYEMLGYVQEHTELNGIVRYGGDLDLVKRLVASGFPVIIERGYIDRHEGWMGHYGLIVGYDDKLQEVTIPDTYLGMIKMSYEEITRYWEQFDRIYLVIFPYERQQEVYDILGAQMDAQYNKEYTLDLVSSQLYEREGLDRFFVWYSRGSICVELNDYLCAGESYDEAFRIYATLKEEERPWRMLWYQTGPYYAYYYLQRYQDLYTLTKQTLDKTPEDAIPETWVWKGRAEVKLGFRDEAIESFKQALFWHPDWWVAQEELIALGEKVD